MLLLIFAQADAPAEEVEDFHATGGAGLRRRTARSRSDAAGQALALEGLFAQQQAERDVADIHTIITALFALEEVF